MISLSIRKKTVHMHVTTLNGVHRYDTDPIGRTADPCVNNPVIFNDLCLK